MKILVTGAAGLIGMHVAKKLIESGADVVGIDNINDYYDQALKYDRLKNIGSNTNFEFLKLDVSDREGVAALFERYRFDRVIHLAAQAGVRYSLENPMAYVDSNIVGMMTILEGCRHNNVGHLIYASSSSVYGMNEKIPFAENDRVDNPVSLYAATKKSNELMAHSYSHLFGIQTTGLRFFTVYGPWGRPDMAPYLFINAIANDKPIKVFNNGDMQRDFTYIDDIVESIVRLNDKPLVGAFGEESGDKNSLCQIYNIGNGKSIDLEDFISRIEQELGKSAEKVYMPMQDGDVYKTFSDTSKLKKVIGYEPQVSLDEGVKSFATWYKSYTG